MNKCYIRRNKRQKTNIMTNQFTRFYKGNLYTLTLVNGEMISAKYEDGTKVFNPSLLDNLERLISLN